MLMSRAHHGNAVVPVNIKQIIPVLLVRTFLFWFRNFHDMWGAFKVCQCFLQGDEAAIFGMS
jgi:hypothetical protein